MSLQTQDDWLMALQWAKDNNKSRLRLTVSPQVRSEEINPLIINQLLKSCSWSYIGEAVTRPDDYTMVNYEEY